MHPSGDLDCMGLSLGVLRSYLLPGVRPTAPAIPERIPMSCTATGAGCWQRFLAGTRHRPWFSQRISLCCGYDLSVTSSPTRRNDPVGGITIHPEAWGEIVNRSFFGWTGKCIAIAAHIPLRVGENRVFYDSGEIFAFCPCVCGEFWYTENICSHIGVNEH